MHKRKYRELGHGDESTRTSSTTYPETFNEPTLDPCLYIQAHEADVIRGPDAASARILEYQDPSIILTTGDNPRSGLIRWGPPDSTDIVDAHKTKHPPLWVDRYDARLLLDVLPDHKSESNRVRSLSPGGWSDLPSDSEDTFFFSPDELDDYRREKRRRLIDRGREERLRILATTEDRKDGPDLWGGSDEEPDETQRELIRKTASHIVSSPNPAQLEMRILANYGTDKRFAFLRGRWSRVWRMEKERVRQNQAEEARKKQLSAVVTPLVGLSGYGESDSDSEEPQRSAETPTSATEAQDDHSAANDVKEARRARAREWSARRRAEQSEQA